MENNCVCYDYPRQAVTPSVQNRFFVSYRMYLKLIEEEKIRNEQVNKMKGFTNDEDIVEVIVLDSSLNDENKSYDENQKDTFNCFICGITKRNSKKFTFICGHSACTLCVKKWKKIRNTCPFCRGEGKEIIIIE